MQFVLLILIAIVPSLVWLFLYLGEDPHPEPRRKILKVFLWGMIIALPALLIEEGIAKTITAIHLNAAFSSLITIFVGIALIEELLKFLVVHDQISKDKDFDEPADAMIYMIIAGLGFATSENFLVLSSYFNGSAGLGIQQLTSGTQIAILRFAGATFLHALVGALLGFFFAYALLHPRERLLIFGAGLSSVTFLHGLFNVGVMQIENSWGILIAGSVILFLIFLVPHCFKKIKKLQGECLVENSSLLPRLF